MNDTVRRKRHLPFVQVSVAVLRRPDLSPSAKALYALLATYVGTDTRETFVGRQRLADDLGVTVRHVGNLVKELQEAGVLEAEARYREAHDEGGVVRKVRTTNNWLLNDAEDTTKAGRKAGGQTTP